MTTSRTGVALYCVRSKSKHEQHGRRRRIFQRRVVLHDERRLPRTGQYRDVLLAIHRIAHRRRIDAGADAKTPSLLQGFGVIRRESSIRLAEEDQISSGGERPGIVRKVEPHRRLDIAGGRIDRLEAAVEPAGHLERAAAEAVARLYRSALIDEILLRHRLKSIAALDRWDVEHVEGGIIGRRLPVLGAKMGRTDVGQRFAAHAVGPRRINLDAGLGIVVGWQAGFRVEPRRPVELVDVLFAADERAGGAVERIEEAVARGVVPELAVLAVDFGVDDRMLGNLVEVERVIRRVLEAPLDLAVVGIEREHARRPLVVARPVLRIPVGAGIADALIDGVCLRIVGGGFPNWRAAVLPMVLAVLPGIVAGLARARDGVGPPRLLAGIEIGGIDEPADAEFTAGGTDDR